MRLFAAIELSESIRAQLAAVRAVVVAADPSWAQEKWVAPENFHITLRFFGEVPDDDAARVLDAVGDAIAGLATPRFEAVRVLATPNVRRARMIWAEWDDVGRIAESAVHAITAVLPEYSPDAEKAFRAHATLCRARQPKGLVSEAMAAATSALNCNDEAMSVPAVSLISSRLTPRGPVYVTIGTRHFGGK
ncbi:MAG TPA: RNA 2',3'-cyclic phosphodiesterase [Coriobacteriia bacterium]|nr:RNA 2',3'-cyclic phosphodiesterase [Coriobacteriia bacterium]